MFEKRFESHAADATQVQKRQVNKLSLSTDVEKRFAFQHTNYEQPGCYKLIALLHLIYVFQTFPQTVMVSKNDADVQ